MFYLLYTSRWGTENECAAREQFKVVMKAQHSNFSISVSGLVINTQYPHLGASPDGVTMCECCGKGVVELKCPYSARDYTVHESALDYVEYAADSIRLKKEHSYFYQVQTQIFLCQAQFAHFAVWTPKGIHIERVEPCVEFFHGVVAKVQPFYLRVILPELIGKWYSKQKLTPCTNKKSSPAEEEQITEEVWCYCRKPEETGKPMIACDNPACPIEWYHMACLNMELVPRGKWYCPDCEQQFKK